MDQRARRIRHRIRLWYRRNGRLLPWRGIRDPYRILLTEIMLQQTQVDRVRVKYPAFLAQFPTLRSLAAAPQQSVVRAWQGMGYNNRAVRLHRLARTIMGDFHGRLPRTAAELRSLPGIGRYTAHAVLSSAFGVRVAIVDINVRRVLSRLFWRMPTTASMRSEAEVWTRADRVLPSGDVYGWNQALMDMGALVCTARQPRCGSCPVGRLCVSRARMRKPAEVRRTPQRSMRNIPNRIYRGKIVEMLRSHRRPVLLSAVGPSILTGFASKHRSWLDGLVAGLERDGVIRIAGNGSRAARRISLA